MCVILMLYYPSINNHGMTATEMYGGPKWKTNKWLKKKKLIEKIINLDVAINQFTDIMLQKCISFYKY